MEKMFFVQIIGLDGIEIYHDTISAPDMDTAEFITLSNYETLQNDISRYYHIVAKEI